MAFKGESQRIEVPFVKNEGLNCGPASLEMVTRYFNSSRTSQEIRELVLSETSGVTWTVGLARAAALMGFGVEFVSTSLTFNASNFDLEFFRTHSDSKDYSAQKISELLLQCKELDVTLREKSLVLDEILSRLTVDTIPIILVDWRKIHGEGLFNGHFLPVVGYDLENVLVHHSGPDRAQPFFPVSRIILDVARKTQGTDEDILFISRPLE